MPAVAKYVPNYFTNLVEKIRWNLLKNEENSLGKISFDIDVANLCSVGELETVKYSIDSDNFYDADRLRWAYGVVLKYFQRVKGLVFTDEVRKFVSEEDFRSKTFSVNFFQMKEYLFTSLDDGHLDLRIESFQICTDSTNLHRNFYFFNDFRSKLENFLVFRWNFLKRRTFRKFYAK